MKDGIKIGVQDGIKIGEDRPRYLIIFQNLAILLTFLVVINRKDKYWSGFRYVVKLPSVKKSINLLSLF